MNCFYEVYAGSKIKAADLKSMTDYINSLREKMFNRKLKEINSDLFYKMSLEDNSEFSYTKNSSKKREQKINKP